ncbi:MAG: FAD:protein FMN transferase [Candidatus Margulisiibacteriota bacterium]
MPLSKASTRRIRVILGIIFVIIVTTILLHILYRPPFQKRSEIMMDTLWTVTVPGGKNVLVAINAVFAREREIDEKFSIINVNSVLNRFNREGTPITDPEVIAVIRQSFVISDLTKGAFDITVGPLVNAFGFYSREFRVPSPDEIHTLLHSVGYKKYLVLSGNVLTKTDPHVEIDFGGITKGYALSEAARILREHHIKNALIDAGGDIYAMGLSPVHRPWRIGIRNPRGEGVIGEVQASDQVIYSSGDYERYFMSGGKRYFHIFNPKTGYPAWGLIASTLICADPFVGAGLSSAVVVMGSEKGLRFINSLPHIAGLVVDEQERIHYSDELKKNASH